MKNPGAIIHGTNDHKALLVYAEHLAHRFGCAMSPMVGILLKLDEAMRDGVDSGRGMSLIIKVRDSGDSVQQTNDTRME